MTEGVHSIQKASVAGCHLPSAFRAYLNDRLQEDSMSRTGPQVRFIRTRPAALFCSTWILLSAIVAATPAAADVVTDWNAVLDAVVPRFGGPQPQSRVQAITQIAVHDALNSIDQRR
jgi:hypothetical protein